MKTNKRWYFIPELASYCKLENGQLLLRRAITTHEELFTVYRLDWSAVTVEEDLRFLRSLEADLQERE